MLHNLGGHHTRGLDVCCLPLVTPSGNPQRAATSCQEAIPRRAHSSGTLERLVNVTIEPDHVYLRRVLLPQIDMKHFHRYPASVTEVKYRLSHLQSRERASILSRLARKYATVP